MRFSNEEHIAVHTVEFVGLENPAAVRWQTSQMRARSVWPATVRRTVSSKEPDKTELDPGVAVQ